jgi:hypothetical protein
MNLNKIVEQLEACNFKCEAGPLELNESFIELKKLAEKEAAKNAASTDDNDGLDDCGD